MRRGVFQKFKAHFSYLGAKTTWQTLERKEGRKEEGRKRKNMINPGYKPLGTAVSMSPSLTGVGKPTWM